MVRADPANCAWCGSPLQPPAAPATALVRCKKCGSATTWPVPSADELDRAYAAWYRPAGSRFAGPGDAVLRRSRGSLARRIDAIAPAGPVLDVGFGDGWLLEALRARGRDTHGLERDTGGLDAAQGPWAAIVFWHSLEHVPSAGSALAKAAEMLLDRGVLVVAMPNFDSLQARLFGERWFALDLPRHLVHVPASALRSRLEELGLTVERESHWRGGQGAFGWLHGLVGSLPGKPNLYSAVRRPEARESPVSGPKRAGVLAAGAALLPIAAAGAGAEVLSRRGGSVYVEARR
jgi:hypothetical protein